MSDFIVIMGISGTGKSTLASEVANQLNWEFVDADSFHSEQSKTLMATGRGISDEARAHWLSKIEHYVKQSTQPLVLAFSGLKSQHRKQLYQLRDKPKFYLLSGDTAIIKQRLQQRQWHFAGPALLNSQQAAFEALGQDENVITLDISEPIATLAKQIYSSLMLIEDLK